MTTASEGFYGYYDNHKNQCLTGQMNPAWWDFTEALAESRSVNPGAKAASPCFKELLAPPTISGFLLY